MLLTTDAPDHLNLKERYTHTLRRLLKEKTPILRAHPQELIISRHSSTDPVDDDAVAGRRHGWGLSGDGVCAAAG